MLDRLSLGSKLFNYYCNSPTDLDELQNGHQSSFAETCNFYRLKVFWSQIQNSNSVSREHNAIRWIPFWQSYIHTLQGRRKVWKLGGSSSNSGHNLSPMDEIGLTDLSQGRYPCTWRSLNPCFFSGIPQNYHIYAKILAITGGVYRCPIEEL